jgi:hypothetical protein
VQVVLGRGGDLAGTNVLANPAFDADPPGTSGASNWSAIPNPSAPTPITVTTQQTTGWGAIHGGQWLELFSSTSGGNGGVFLTSDPIPVTAGQRWTAAAYVTSAGNSGNSATLYATWYSSDDTIDSVSFPSGTYPDWALLRDINGDGIQVPAGAAFLRAVLALNIHDVGYMHVGYMLARQVN